MRNFILCVLVLSLLSVSALAASNVYVSPIKNAITTAEQAEFTLKITNHADKAQRYSIYSLQSGQGWNVDPSPLRDRIIDLGPQQTYSTKILVRPLEDFAPGIYNVNVNVESDMGERYSKSLKMYLSPEKPLDYLPTIKATLDMDEKIDPREPVSVKLFLENKNPLDLKDLQISIQSDMAEFQKEVAVNLPPLEKKTVEFTITPNQFQQPKDYILFFVFQREGETVKVLDKRIEIVSLTPGFSIATADETIFMKKFSSVTIRNEGNVRNKQEVMLPLTFWQALFIKSDEATVKSIEGQRNIVWEVNLGPNESVTKGMVTNYRIGFYGLVALLVLLIFYLIVRSPVQVTKKAIASAHDRDGTLSQLKITLEVQNKSSKPLRNITVIEYVPTIANIERSLELGTLKPLHIKHTKKGTKVSWSLAELDAGEHRIITYKVKSKLNILGTFSLPRAIVQYSKRRGKERKSYSNVTRIKS